MRNNIKKGIALFLCVLLLCTLLPASISAADSIWSGWTYDGWTSDDEILSYGGTDMGAAKLVTRTEAPETNRVSFEIRRDAAALTGNAHYGVLFTTTAGDGYYFMYSSADGYSCVKRFPQAGGEEFINPTGGIYPSIPVGEWTSFEVIFDETAANFYIGGVLQHTVPGDFTTLFAGAKVSVMDYATPISVNGYDLSVFTDPWASWEHAGWTEHADCLSLPGTDFATGYVAESKTGASTNCVTVYLRMDGNANANNGHMGLSMLTLTGDRYYFKYATADGYSCVQKHPAGGGEIFLNAVGQYPTVPTGEWVEFKIIYDSSSVDFYINGVLNHSVAGDYATLFEGAKYGVLTYATPVSFKPGSVEPVEVELWSGWDKDTENDCWSYAGGDLGSAHLLQYKNTLTTNCIEISLRLNEAVAQDNGHLGIYLRQSNGDSIYFMCNPCYAYASIIRYPAGGGEEYLNTGEAHPSLQVGTWTSFKVVATEEYLAFYVGNSLQHLLYGDYSGFLTDCKPCVCDYACNASARIVNLDNAEIGGSSAYDFPDNWGYNANWTLAPEGYLSYNANEMISTVNCNAILHTDSLSYSFRVTDTVTADDSNLGLILKCKDGYSYFFQYNSYVGYGGQGIWVNEMPVDMGTRWITKVAGAALSDGEWHTVDCLFRDEVIAIFVDGQLVCYHFGDYAGRFDGATCYIQSYKTPMDLKVNSVGAMERNVLDYDFEFNSAEAVNDFTAENGTLSHDGDSALVFNVTGENASFVSPTIPDCVGYKYSALATVHNTILMRLKNNTAAEQFRVFITTDSGTVFRDIAVAPYSDYASYFVNFSQYDVTGYIRQVRFAPLGVSAGSVELEAFTFEREMPDDETAGTITSCVADFDAGTVTVTGKLIDKYAGHTVTIYETNVRNVMSTLSGDILGTVTPNGTDFTFTFPLYAEGSNISRLPSYFVAGCDGVRFDERFLIDNGAEAEENPYAFDLPELTVSVADFGAVGDAFTDDTAAIQAAIDYVAAQGGGTVVVPGEPDEFYEKRYMVTNVVLRSYVELHIEDGAILWQSPRKEEYNYTPAYGHNAFLEVQIPWSAAAFVTNWPLVSGYELENAKLTGSGTIRGADHGGESWDGCTGENRDLNCDSLIHCMSTGWYHCKNMEISGVHLERSGGYHCIMMYCENMCIEDIEIYMPICTEADIVSPAGSKNVLINYVHGYSNDDSVVLSTSKEDPRGYACDWWDCRPDDDNSCRNVTVCHSSFCGGKGLTFIAWGTSKEDISETQIENIHAYDCRFNTLATWYDNPYHGTPYFTSLEHDYSTVSHVRIENCWFDSTPSFNPIPATDVVTDVEGLHSATQFEYGGFDRNDPDYPDWICNLAGWTVREDGGTAEELTKDGTRVGKLTGTASLSQGLYMSMYYKTFTADVTVAQGCARMFIRDIVSGEEIASLDLPQGSGTYELPFIGTDTNLDIGVEGTSADAVVYLDNFAIIHADEGAVNDLTHPSKENYIVNQSKSLVELKNSNAGTIMYRNGNEGTPTVALKNVEIKDNFEISFTVKPDCKDNMLRTFLSNSDDGKQIIMDFRYYNDNQLYINYQFKKTRKEFFEAHQTWVSLPQGSREYHVSMTHENGADVLLLQITDANGTVVYSKALEHMNYTDFSFYSLQYGLNFRIFDWTPNCELSDLYVGKIGENTEPEETYTVRWLVDGVFTDETYRRGETPEYKGSLEKASDENCRYVFDGWHKELMPVSENITYKALFRELPPECPHANTEAIPAVPASCVAVGYTEGVKCTDCGEILTAPVEIAALGHDYVDGVCSRCGAEDPDYVAKDPCEGYTDINRSSWYHSAADYVIKNGYMGSTKTDKLVFEPNTKVSRAMVASIMYRIAGSPDVEYKGSFTDVPSGKWFTAAIEWAAQNGLASGKGAGKFDPNGNVTRQELAVFMYKLSEHLGNDVTGRADLSEFADAASVPSWAKSFVEWAVAAGLISGKSNNGVTKLAPVDNATRAEFASIIMRFMCKPV